MSKTTTTSAKAPKKNVGCRILAALLFLACVGILFLPISTFTGAWTVEKQNLISTIKDLLASKTKLFGVLPVLLSGGVLPLGASGALYLFMGVIAVSAILSFIAIFAAKKAPCLVRTVLFFLTWGAVAYVAAMFVISRYIGSVKTTLDVYTLLIAIVAAALYFLFALAKVGKGAWLSAAHFLLSACVTGLLLLGIIYNASKTASALNGTTAKAILAIVLVFLALNLFIASIRIMCKKGLGLDVVRFALQLVAVLVACYVYYATDMKNGSYLFFAILAGGVALVQLLITTMQIVNKGKKNAKDAADAALADFRTEEYVEAYAYEGGPVAGVEIAEEVNPTVASVAAASNPEAINNIASLLGNGFDPFLIQLTNQEKEEFIDLYVLKCKGNMPEIPGYVVGGDNKDFFNKIFIYLGQYREKIPNGLLEKMYKFSMKLS